jgi:hypothetical protein
MLLQAFTLGLNIGNKEITGMFKETLNEPTSAQKEGGDMIDAFLSESEFSALVTPGDAPCPTSMNFLYIHISKAGVV